MLIRTLSQLGSSQDQKKHLCLNRRATFAIRARARTRAGHRSFHGGQSRIRTVYYIVVARE